MALHYGVLEDCRLRQEIVGSVPTAEQIFELAANVCLYRVPYLERVSRLVRILAHISKNDRYLFIYSSCRAVMCGWDSNPLSV